MGIIGQNCVFACDYMHACLNACVCTYEWIYLRHNCILIGAMPKIYPDPPHTNFLWLHRYLRWLHRKLHLYSTSYLWFYFQNHHVLLPVCVQCMATHISSNAQLRLADEQHPSGGECVRPSQSSNSASLCHFGNVDQTVYFMCK